MTAAQIESLHEFIFDHGVEFDADVMRVDGCDNTHRYTRAWAKKNGFDEELLVAFVEKHGGNCDCTVICNVGPERLDS